MALFKILKGNSSNISTAKTPFHDGYAYFTPDDGGFYIDSYNGANPQRTRINPPAGGTSVNATLLASGWTNGKQTVAVSGMTATANGIVGLAQAATTDQINAAKNATLCISAQQNGSITILAAGTTPSCDIPISVIIL